MLVCVHATWTKERATSEHACTWKRACTHTSALPAAKTGVRKLTNPEQRRESVGQPRGAAAANQRRGAREFRVGFPLSAHELLVARARQTGRGKKKKKKKEWESARTSKERREGYTRLVKRSEEEGGRRKKKRRVTSLHRIAPPGHAKERARGEREREWEGARSGEKEREKENAEWECPSDVAP